jgi:excisionase family DNA binding protein
VHFEAVLPDAALEALAQRAAALVLAELDARGSDRWLGTAEAAEHLGCAPRRIRDLVERGVLPHGRDGSRLLIRRSVLDSYAEALNDDDRVAGPVVGETSTRAPREVGVSLTRDAA